MGGPAHPLVDEDCVGPHLVRHYHALERVRLQQRGPRHTEKVGKEEIGGEKKVKVR
jgi:hypothetical protein